ncbi:MAG: N-acetyltransferase [Deltaproteobacteria bacterium]|nr:N-acetyltransferase [Deltaproteobacteria bacterium]
MIRKAVVSEVIQIQRVLNHYGDKGILLPRSLSELYEHLRDFYVFTDDEEKIIGVCALNLCWEELAEIRSLAVVEKHQGNNYGVMLIERCVEEAKTLGLKRLFTLTYLPEYFKKLGFSIVDKSELPHKVWSDCIKCTKFPDCDETALIREI